MFRGNCIDCVEVCALAIQAHRNNGLGPRRDRSLQQRRVQVVGARIDVHVHRLGAQQRHRLGSGDVRKTRCDDFIARPDAKRHLSDLQSIRAIGHGDAMFGAGIGRQLLFQLGHFRPKDVLTMRQHTLNRRVDLVLDAGLLGLEVDEFDHGVLASNLVTALPSST
ncbi:hypothetical protein D3C85_1351360 [compost metagenome]